MPSLRLNLVAAAGVAAAISFSAGAQEVCVSNATQSEVQLGDLAPPRSDPIAEVIEAVSAEETPALELEAAPYDPAAWAPEATLVLTAPAGERVCVRSPARFGGTGVQVAVGCARWGGYMAALNVIEGGATTQRGRFPLLATVGADTVAAHWDAVAGTDEDPRDVVVAVLNPSGACQRSE